MADEKLGKCTVVMRSGNRLVFNCTSVTIDKSKFETTISGITIKGIEGENFLYLNLHEIEAVLWDVPEVE